MIYLLHGEDQTRSREALKKLRQAYDPSAVTALIDFSPAPFIEACEGRSFFSGKCLIVVEIRGRTAGPEPHLLEYLAKIPEANDVAIWFEGKLKSSEPLLKELKGFGQITYFGLAEEKPFPFLDALGEKDLAKSYRELRSLLAAEQSPIFLVQMVAWKIKNLIQVKTGATEEMNAYVLRRARPQAKNFLEDDLVRLLGSVLESDLQLKLGADAGLVLDRLVYEIAGD